MDRCVIEKSKQIKLTIAIVLIIFLVLLGIGTLAIVTHMIDFSSDEHPFIDSHQLESNHINHTGDGVARSAFSKKSSVVFAKPIPQARVAVTCDGNALAKNGLAIITGKIPYIGSPISLLLNTFWPDVCAFDNIKSLIQASVDELRLEMVRNKYDGFNSSLSKIKYLGLDEDFDTVFNFYIGPNHLFL